MSTAEQDYYALLGVERGASDDEIKRAFRRLARDLHPDVSAAPDAQERFREVAEAYEVLSDPERRRTYDRFGVAGLRSGGFQPSSFDLGNLSDVFAAFFGDGLFGGGGGRATRPTRGADVGARVEITLAEALTGTTVAARIVAARTCVTCDGSGAAPGSEPVTCSGCGGAGVVRQVGQSIFGQVVRTGTCPTCEGTGRVIPTPCSDCEGDGRTVETVLLDVEVPAGIHHGQRIRLRGQGHDGMLGGPRGDAYVQVDVASLPGVERDGDDLHVLAEVTMLEAALGATVEVPTPEGPLAVDLEGGVQPGTAVRVPRRGMPSLETGRRGDLLVHVQVRIPVTLTQEQRGQLEQLADTLGPDAYRSESEGFFDRLRQRFR